MDRVLRAVCVAIIIFATIVAFVVGSRIDQNTISLLSGTVIGVLVAAPCAAIITFVLVRRREPGMSSYDRGMRHSTPLPQNPPQYWVMPPQFAATGDPAYAQNRIAAGNMAMLGWPGTQQADVPYLPRPRRRFYVIGENGEPRALEESATTSSVNDPYDLDSDEPGAAF